MIPYYIIGETVFDAVVEGAIAPDDNPAWLGYLDWLAEGNEPEVRPESQGPPKPEESS